MYKQCSKCGIEKTDDQFNRKNSKVLQAYCRTCQKKWYKEYYKSSNKEKERLKRKRKRMKRESRAYLRELKTNTPCVDCGKKFHFCAMDFDHIETKTIEVSRMIGNQATIEKIKEEVSKCELVCSNCHRVRTYKRKYSGVA